MIYRLVRYVLIAAVRDRMLWGVVAVSVLGACLSIFSGSVAIIEQDQFVIAYLGGGLRILSLIGLVLFVVFYTRRSFDSRDVEFLLTRPVSRTGFVLAHVVAFSLLSVAVGVLLSAIVLVFSWSAGMTGGAAMWAFGVTMEYILVANTAFFFSMVLSSPVTAGLGTLGFYVLARMMGNLLAIADLSSSQSSLFHGLDYLMKIVAVIVPRLDLMAQTSWLIYGGASWSDWGFVLLQGGVFLVLIASATVIDLKRRQF